MPIKFSCVCGKHIAAPSAAAGKQGKCPACGRDLVVPPKPGGRAASPPSPAPATAPPPEPAPPPVTGPERPRRIAPAPTELTGRATHDAPVRISIASRAGYLLSLPSFGLQVLLLIGAGLHWHHLFRLPQDLEISASLHVALDPTAARIYLGLVALFPLLALYLCLRGLITGLTSHGAIRAGGAAWAGAGLAAFSLALAGGQQYLYARVPLRLEAGYLVWGDEAAPAPPAAAQDRPAERPPTSPAVPPVADPKGVVAERPTPPDRPPADPTPPALPAAPPTAPPTHPQTPLTTAPPATGTPATPPPVAAGSPAAAPPTSAPPDAGPSAAEAAAAAALAALVEAEREWRRGDGDGNGVRDYWTANVAGLAAPRHGTARVSPALAAADAAAPSPAPLGGYLFAALVLDPYGYPYRLDLDADGQATTNPSVFAFAAAPADGHGGTLVVAQDGVVWAKDLAGKPVTDYPAADPAAAGWHRVK